MLKSMDIVNFQSHADTHIDFSPGITVIVGSSDSGKSVIVRVLEWLRTNRPLGNAFIRKGTDSCKVTLQNVAGDNICREKGKGINQYIVNGELYKALKSDKTLKSDVPVQVSEALNLSDINVQHQLDQHFLVLETPGKTARYINNITKLEDADTLLANINGDIRKSTSLCEELEIGIKYLDKQLADPIFGMLGDVECLINKRSVLVEEYKSAEDLIDLIVDVLSKLEVIDLSVSKVDKVLCLEQPILDVGKTVYDLSEDIGSLVDDILWLHNCLVSYVEVAVDLRICCSVLDREESCLLLLEEGVGLGADYIKYNDELTSIISICDGLLTVDVGLCTVESDIKIAEAEREDLISNMSTCPLCESVLDNDKRDHVIACFK